MAESEELKSLLMKVKEKSEKVALKLNIQNTNIMLRDPITSQLIDGKQWKQCQNLFWGVAEKAMTPYSSILAWKIPWMEEPGGLQSMGSQSRTRLSDFTFTFHIIKTMFFPVVMYGCAS